MAKAGDVLENPVTGQRLIFRITGEDSGGDLLEVESTWTRPSASRPPAHYHIYQEERFEILSGNLNVLIDGQRRTLRAGEVLTIAPGVPHQMWTEEGGVRVTWQTRPALKTEAFFETVWGLAKDGKVNDKGVPNLLRVALIAREYEDEFRLASPPWAVQRALFGLLAPVGRVLLGYHVRYPYPHGDSEKTHGTATERPSFVSGATVGRVLGATIVGLSLLFLLGRLRRQSRR